MQFKASSLFLAVLMSSSLFRLATSFCDRKSSNDVYLDLSGVGIKRLQPKFVSGESITCLNLKGNDMEHIGENAFAGLPNLTDLNLEGSSINFETFRLHNFPKLTTLVIDRTFPPRYYDSHYDRSETSTANYYYGHSGRRLQPRIGKSSEISLPLLEELSMCNYSASETVNVLKKFNVPNLKRLRLNGNGLTDYTVVQVVPPHIIQNITDLELNDNDMTYFSGIISPEVRNLTLNNNKFQKLCSDYFCDERSISVGNMLHLENLVLVNNEINGIYPDALANLAQLVSLNLAGNSIESIAKQVFDNSKKLQYLNLDDNRFNEIPDICALTELRELSINGNALTSIDSGSFCDLKKLSRVSLKKTGLINVASGSFEKLPMLKTLDLSWNDIERLPENWAKSDSAIEELNLDGNRFTDISHMSLGQFKALKYVRVGHNPLRTIKIGSLINLPVNTTLDVNRVCENENIPIDPYNSYQ